MPKSHDRVAAIEAAERVDVRVEPSYCDACEGQCWSAEVHAIGFMAGREWRTCLLFVDHQPMSTALLAVGRAFGNIGGQAREREAKRWMLEHQPRLW